MFPETKSRETLRFEPSRATAVNSELLTGYLRFQPSRATAVNSELLTG